MLVVTNSWRIWLAGMVASLIIFAVVYFAVIAPDNNTANQALKQGIQQVQAAESQAQTQLSNATGQTNSAAVRSAVSSGQTALTTAQKLAACVASAGTDVTKITACQAKYTP